MTDADTIQSMRAYFRAGAPGWFGPCVDQHARSWAAWAGVPVGGLDHKINLLVTAACREGWLVDYSRCGPIGYDATIHLPRGAVPVGGAPLHIGGGHG